VSFRIGRGINSLASSRLLTDDSASRVDNSLPHKELAAWSGW